MAGVGIIAALLITLNFSYVMAKFQGRPKIWLKTLKVSLQRPYVGWGYRSFTREVTQSKALGSLGNVELSRAHCDPLHAAQELGWPIVILAGGFFLQLWRKFEAKQNKDKLTYILASSVFIVLVNMAGQTFCRYASVMSTWIILLAFLSIKLEEAANA